MRNCTTQLSGEQDCMQLKSTGEQFNDSPIIGFNIGGNTVPVFYAIDHGGGNYVKGPVYYGKRYHHCFLWEDKFYSACCKAVMKFNVKHYTKCYLPGRLGKNGAITTPYTFNKCNMCGSSIDHGDCPRVFERETMRRWSNHQLVYRACETRQDCGKCEDGYPTTVDNSSGNSYNESINSKELNV